MAVLPLEDLPAYLLSLRAAWCGDEDPLDEFEAQGGYWKPKQHIEGLPNRPLFTMGQGATMSVGIAIAYKSVPLPTVLENLWEAEKERAKKLPQKDGLCFRLIYGGGNTLEALMKGELLKDWYQLLRTPSEKLSPLFLRLAEELPKRASVTQDYQLFAKAANVIMLRRDEKLDNFADIETWLNAWEQWVLPHTRMKSGSRQVEDSEGYFTEVAIRLRSGWRLVVACTCELEKSCVVRLGGEGHLWLERWNRWLDGNPLQSFIQLTCAPILQSHCILTFCFSSSEQYLVHSDTPVAHQCCLKSLTNLRRIIWILNFY